MIVLRILGFLLKLVLKILLLPILLIVWTVSLLLKLVVHIGSIPMGLLMLVGLIGIAMSVYEQDWRDVGLLFGIEVCIVGVTFAAGLVQGIVEMAAESMTGLLFS